jgi:hypothetical protein
MGINLKYSKKHVFTPNWYYNFNVFSVPMQGWDYNIHKTADNGLLKEFSHNLKKIPEYFIFFMLRL